jgi:hypothetical protein
LAAISAAGQGTDCGVWAFFAFGRFKDHRLGGNLSPVFFYRNNGAVRAVYALRGPPCACKVPPFFATLEKTRKR